MIKSNAAVAEQVQVPLRPLYLEAVARVERMHRRLLDIIKDEFDRANLEEINSVQALLIFNIGDREVTAGELYSRGIYLGSNVSYNLKKLIDLKYLSQERSKIDKRLIKLKITEKGNNIYQIMSSLYDRHINTVKIVGGIKEEDFSSLNTTLSRLEQFWIDQILYKL